MVTIGRPLSTDALFRVWQLTEVVRSSQRIVAGAAAFQLGENKAQVTSQHNATGPPLKSFMFDLEGDPIEAYAQHTLRALNHVITTFGTLELHDRVAIVVPDEQFAAAFSGPLAAALLERWPSRPFTLVSAQEAAASALPSAGGRGKEGEWLVLDSIAAFDGLERLIVIAVCLDAVIEEGLGSSTLETRSRLYRALTRAHMMAVVVNEFLPGGWLEFLGHVSLKDGSAAFNRKDEMENKMKADAVDGVTSAAKKKAEGEEKDAAQKVQKLAIKRQATKGNLGDRAAKTESKPGPAGDKPAATLAAAKVEKKAEVKKVAAPAAKAEKKAEVKQVAAKEAKAKPAPKPAAKQAQSVWDTSENETTKASGPPAFNPYDRKAAGKERHLTIVRAWYGDPQAVGQNARSMDVTEQVRREVRGNTLRLNEQREEHFFNRLFGSDPAPGVYKNVVVTYRHGDGPELTAESEAVLDEQAPLIIEAPGVQSPLGWQQQDAAQLAASAAPQAQASERKYEDAEFAVDMPTAQYADEQLAASGLASALGSESEHEVKLQLKVIGRSIRDVAATPLVLLKKKQIYAQDMFESEQQAYQEHVRSKLQQLHVEMKARMLQTYEAFRDGGDDVQREWSAFVEQMDKQVEDSLVQTVKRSLQELSRSINGDAETEVQPLFQIHVTLQGSKVGFKPSIAELTQSVSSVSKDAIATTTAMPRLSEVLKEGSADEGLTKPTFYMHISNDEDTLKVLVQVMTGIREIKPRLVKYLTMWDRYKHIWDVDKDAFMKRYAKANRALTAFETDITRYKELQHDIQSEEGITNVGFIRIDSSPLKQALVAHCHTWQNKFTQLLNNNAATELRGLYDHMQQVQEVYKKRPVNLDQLGEHIHLLEAEEAAFEKTEGRFEPLEAQYKLLEKFEVVVKEAELAQLAGLKAEWQAYKKLLNDVGIRLQKVKADFEADLEGARDQGGDQGGSR